MATKSQTSAQHEATWTLHRGLGHVFVVVRLETDEDPTVPIEDRVYLTKAFWTKEDADAEAERLNSIRRSDQYHYVSHMARFPLPNLTETDLKNYAFDVLDELELRFGKRDPSFAFEGVVFSTAPDPGIFFPDTYESRRVVVRLTESTRRYPYQALFQLAHACVHLLDPVTADRVTVLEQGLAACFQIEFVSRFDRTYCQRDDSRWTVAAQLVSPLIQNFPDAIKSIRGRGVQLSEISPGELIAECPGLDLNRAMALTRRFDEFKQIESD